MDCGTMFVTNSEEYHLQMALESWDVHEFFLEYEMHTALEDYHCNEKVIFHAGMSASKSNILCIEGSSTQIISQRHTGISATLY